MRTAYFLLFVGVRSIWGLTSFFVLLEVLFEGVWDAGLKRGST